MCSCPSQSDDADMLARAVAGDVEALELLLLRHHDRLVANVSRHLSPIVKRTVSPEDIVQETYIRAFKRIGTFAPRGDDAFYRWLCVIAGNQMRDAASRHFAAKRGGDGQVHGAMSDLLVHVAGHEKTPSGVAARREGVAALHVAMAGLSEDYRRVIELRYIQQCDVAKTAKIMGRTDRAIHMLCHRALKEIAQAMGRASAFLSSRA